MEITEGVLLSGNLMTDALFASFTSMGIEMTMDDFGTGYSSLNYLRRYPFAILKIDRSFINDMITDTDSGDRELVNASIAMAHGLSLKVVAEGLETKAQANALKAMQYDYVHGYFYSRPIPADILTERSNTLKTANASHCQLTPPLIQFSSVFPA